MRDEFSILADTFYLFAQGKKYVARDEDWGWRPLADSGLITHAGYEIEFHDGTVEDLMTFIPTVKGIEFMRDRGWLHYPYRDAHPGALWAMMSGKFGAD